eukprot:CAMPEP_0184861988 /NCGR_PEP_ID=MMETSP0580-20130426/6539_1 /TAXON_ID=1118495 /ORGANISM="Dactyliosolen fragilissimus" /LENGTH=357 /DNA_ID=CAMNT_0027359671 /DNA_START=40 /DNA_END=1113 /DNA_ORIENTATION=+
MTVEPSKQEEKIESKRRNSSKTKSEIKHFLLPKFTIYLSIFVLIVSIAFMFNNPHYVNDTNTFSVVVSDVSIFIHHRIYPPSVRKSIVKIIEEDLNRRNDGTSLIGTFVRLAWHASGTYSVMDGSGGSNGGRIRHAPEKGWDANAGLNVAMDALEPVKAQHSNLSYADLYTFAGKVAVEYAGGPLIPFRFGRLDDEDGEKSPQDGRLPDADKGTDNKTAKHMRDIFQRLGFNDREMVCLMGAHTLGRCHIDRSGYWGPWNKAENKFNNALFKFLLDMQWTIKKKHDYDGNGKKTKWKGPKQYENPSGELMMLPSCMATIRDTKMKEYVELYAKDEKLFFDDFALVFGKLLALGFEQG